MYEFLQEVQSYLAGLPNLLLAIVVFLAGWLVALIVSKFVKAGLSRTKWDNKLFDSFQINDKYKPEIVISKTIYYLLLVVVLIVALDIMNLNIVAQPLLVILTEFAGSVPNIVKAGVILLVGWLVASMVRLLIQRGGATLRVNKLLHKWNIVESDEQALAALKTVGKVVFYLVILMFIPGILSALNITAISNPISEMVSQFLLFVPKLFAAALTLLIGWLVAKVVREIVTNVLKGIGLEKLADKLHLSKVLEKTTLSSVIGTIAYIIILIVSTIAALDALELEGISQPAAEMLQVVLTMLPNVLIAIVLVLIGVWLGRWVGQLVARLLEQLGFNSLFNYLGLIKLSQATTATLSQIAGRITQIIIIVIFTVQALNIINLHFLVNIFQNILSYLPSVLTAVIILGIGLYLGTLVQQVLSNIVKPKWKLLVSVAQYGIITISVFMALNQLGVATAIVTSAFIILLSGVSLALALAFGLGGREFAAQWLNKWNPISNHAQSTNANPEPTILLEGDDTRSDELK